MLKRFSVSNFKCFDSKLVFDLSHPCNYEFNGECLSSGCIAKGIIYGMNGCGKSNLALALFDIILHLTDKEKLFSRYQPYLNLNSKKSFAEFEYVFSFDNQEVKYQYRKIAPDKLLYESLSINDEEVLSYDFRDNQGYTTLKGAENLNLISNKTNISRVKFLRSNAILEDNAINHAFLSFTDFVDNMLMFYCLDDRGYQGFHLGSDSFTQGIIRYGKLKDFETFLNEQGVECVLVEHTINGIQDIYYHFEKEDMPFMLVSSTGTKSLGLFYYWYLRMREASLVFIDEFDAFYHFELAECLVNLLKGLSSQQILLSTHNTDLLSNDLLRPDCYFELEKGKIKSLDTLTGKELRKAHNLQKMYKAGAFNG